MSDDEGGESYGDYDDLGGIADDPAPDPAEAGEGGDDGPEEGDPGRDPEVGPEEGDDEAGLDEDAAGTDEDDDDPDKGDEGDGAGDDEEPAEPGVAPQKAHPQRAKVDPLLRVSNKPRTIILIPPDERVTDNRLHKNEAAALIATRAEQIDKYATHFARAPGLRDSVEIAFRELYERRCPLNVRRQVGTGPNGEDLVEEWSVREMTLPLLTPPASLGSSAPPL